MLVPCILLVLFSTFLRVREYVCIRCELLNLHDTSYGDYIVIPIFYLRIILQCLQSRSHTYQSYFELQRFITSVTSPRSKIFILEVWSVTYMGFLLKAFQTKIHLNIVYPVFKLY